MNIVLRASRPEIGRAGALAAGLARHQASGTSVLVNSGDVAGADVVVDLDGEQSPPADTCRWLRVSFDGRAIGPATYTALRLGRMPIVEISEPRTGAVVARGEPCANDATNLGEAVDCMFARLPALVALALRSRQGFALAPLKHGAAPDLTTITAKRLKAAAFDTIRGAYRVATYAPHWVIGYRFNHSASVWTSQCLDGEPWRILPDPGTRFYADPFPIVVDGRCYVFFEDLPHATQKGVISYVEITPDGPSGPVRPVLEEAWHLSYPQVLHHQGEIYMVPESGSNREVALYRADPFPTRWTRVATLLEDIEASDATITQFDGRFWMFATVRDGAGSHSDMLALFHATNLLGPWSPHPANPVLVGQTEARPAGRMVLENGRLWRPVQNCRHGYGTGLGLAEITHLDLGSYEQVVRKVLWPSKSWPGRKLHTLNQVTTPHGLLECIDGSDVSPRLKMLANMMPNRRGRHIEA